MDTTTRTFPISLASDYTPNSIIELCHFRDMTFDADERVGVYLEAFFCNLNLKSFNLGVIPNFDGDESEAEKMAKFSAAETKSQKLGLRILYRKNNVGDWIERAEIILVNRGRKDYFDLLQPYLAKNQVAVLETNDALALQLIDYGNGLLKQGDSLFILAAITVSISKKNDVEELENRLASLELAINGKLTNINPNHFLGREINQGVITQIPFSRFATQATIDQAIIDLVGGAPGALNTLIELANALNNDANFAATITNNLAEKVSKILDENIDGKKTFLKAIKTPFFEKDISIRFTTGINWLADTWYTIPDFIVSFLSGEVRAYHLTVNYQYPVGTGTSVHFQMGGHCFLAGGIGWKQAGTLLETVMPLQHHSGGDNFTFTFRTSIAYNNRPLQIKPNFDVTVNGIGFIEFSLMRFT